jgi:hypothetical protein
MRMHPHHRKLTGKPLGLTVSKQPASLIALEPIGKIDATLHDIGCRWEFLGEAVNLNESTDPIQI